MLHILIDCALLWAFWHVAWKSLAVEMLRCSIYRIRNQLFDMAASRFEGLTLSGRQYQVIRQHLSARLWHSRDLSSIHLYVAPIVLRVCGIRMADLKPGFQEYVEAIRSEQLRKQIQSMIRDANIHTVFYFLMTSPLLFTASIVSAIILVGSLLIHRKKSVGEMRGQNVLQKFKEENLARKAEIIEIQADIMEEGDECPAAAVMV